MRAILLLTVAACGFQSRGEAPAPAEIDGGAGVIGDATRPDTPTFTPCTGYLSLQSALEPSSYRIVTTPARFKNAELDCETDRGHLVILDSEVERLAVAAAVADGWIGYSDLKQEGMWIDVAGRSSSYMTAGWASNEPSTGENDNCAHLSATGLDAKNCGKSDGSEGESHGYVCECDHMQGMASNFRRPD